MSFWPRGRTLVRGWRRDLRSLMVESTERLMGIDLPLNLTVILIKFWVSLSSISPVASPLSIFPLLGFLLPEPLRESSQKRLSQQTLFDYNILSKCYLLLKWPPELSTFTWTTPKFSTFLLLLTSLTKKWLAIKYLHHYM